MPSSSPLHQNPPLNLVQILQRSRRQTLPATHMPHMALDDSSLLGLASLAAGIQSLCKIYSLFERYQSIVQYWSIEAPSRCRSLAAQPCHYENVRLFLSPSLPVNGLLEVSSLLEESVRRRMFKFSSLRLLQEIAVDCYSPASRCHGKQLAVYLVFLPMALRGY